MRRITTGFRVTVHPVRPSSARGHALQRFSSSMCSVSSRTGEALDALASPAFQTDSGVRSMSGASAEFDPNSYSKGSVSALGSSSVALAFWGEHRSVTAEQIWNGLLSWNTLDSPGHLHEVAAGDFFHPEIESIPEQTWSSAGFYSAAVHGLLGLQVDGAKRQLTFAPHLPAEWDHLTIGKVRVGQSLLKLELKRSQNGLDLTVENEGPAVWLNSGRRFRWVQSR